MKRLRNLSNQQALVADAGSEGAAATGETANATSEPPKKRISPAQIRAQKGEALERALGRGTC